MKAWSDLPWSSALCFLLAFVLVVCVLFLLWDSFKHREPMRVKQSPFAVGRDCYRFVKGVHK